MQIRRKDLADVIQGALVRVEGISQQDQGRVMQGLQESKGTMCSIALMMDRVVRATEAEALQVRGCQGSPLEKVQTVLRATLRESVIILETVLKLSGYQQARVFLSADHIASVAQRILQQGAASSEIELEGENREGVIPVSFDLSGWLQIPICVWRVGPEGVLTLYKGEDRSSMVQLADQKRMECLLSPENRSAIAQAEMSASAVTLESPVATLQGKKIAMWQKYVSMVNKSLQESGIVGYYVTC